MPTAAERFEAWLHAPVAFHSRDARVGIRRVAPEDFPLVFAVVDAAFGTRPPALYDWLYRRNPLGPARCLAAVEHGSGRYVAVNAMWPWPMARGDTDLPALLSGDRATVPDWQRRGLFGIFRNFRIAHPWRGVGLAWPNSLSQNALARQGRGHELLGPLRRAVVLLDPLAALTRRGVPSAVAEPLARVCVRTLAAVRRRRLGGGGRLRTVEVERFDARVDDLAASATRGWSGFWCPRGADFLNWRYAAHPSHVYATRAVVDGERLLGYAVTRLRGGAALLMELATDPAAADAAPALLGAVLALVREAGCDRLEVLASAPWPHWPLLRRVGAIDRPSTAVVQARGPEPDTAHHLDAWRLNAGDIDTE